MTFDPAVEAGVIREPQLNKIIQKQQAYPPLSLTSGAVRECGAGLATVLNTYKSIIYTITFLLTYRTEGRLEANVIMVD